jgi:uncharacterized protein YecE (DUF72 family)
LDFLDSDRKIRIGTAGWSYKDWEGIFYPPGLQRRKIHPLEYLARFFDVVEINTSFYGHIKPELARIWCKKASAVNPDFVFTAKLHKAFTHSPLAVMEPTSAATIKPTDEDEAQAREGLDVLAAEGKLGALLIQFPVSFKNTSLNREYLENLARQFIEYPRVVEVRHSSWNNPETIAHFARMNLAFCNIDQPQIGRSLEATEHVTTPIGYVRLHGRNYDQWFDCDNRDDRYNYLYTETEILGWREKVERIADQAETVYVVANNHFEAKSGVNALEMKYLLSGKRVTAPPTLIRHYPVLAKIADPAQEDVDPNLSLLA